MADVSAIYHWTDGDTITAARLNTIEGIVTEVNANFFQLNKASQIISVAFSVSAAVTISSGGLTVSANGITVTGNSTITGTLTALTGITSSGTAAFATVTASAAITAGTGLTITTGNLVLSSGQAVLKRLDAGDSGTAKTLDWDSANWQKVRLTGNCTFTLNNGRVGGMYYLELLQDGTGSRTITLPAGCKTGGNGAAITLTTAASHKDLLVLLCVAADTYLVSIFDLNFNETT